MKDLLRISLVQFDVCWENPVANRLKLDNLLSPLTGQTDLILLPEMFTTGFTMNAKELAEPMNGDSIDWMKSQAKKTGAALAGSLIIVENDFYYNRFLFVEPSGEIASYDKKHLFSMGGEDRYFNHGGKRVIVDYCGWRIALFICYDLRFPVWCRSIKDADLILFTANWPDARKHVWQILTKARAIENQLYVAGINRTGIDGAGVYYSGESMVIDPKGEIVCKPEGESDVVATTGVSMEELKRFRKKFPVSVDDDYFEICG
jgi:predicted amidohydrolase